MIDEKLTMFLQKQINENYQEQQILKKDIVGISVPITWENNISELANAENSIRVNKTEKSCVLTFTVNRSAAIESAFTIGTFDAGYAPKNLVVGAGICNSGGTTYGCQLSIDSDGSININNRGHSSYTFRGQIKWYY